MKICSAFVAVGLGFWSAGASAAVVSYDPTAPESNFSSPGPSSDQVAYTTSLTADATDIFGTITARPDLGGTYNSGLQFANLYFGTGASAASGSDFGIEVTNDQAFVPGASGYYSLAGTGFSYTSDTTTGVISFEIPWNFFETDPLGMGFDTVSASNPDVVMRLSQSFGYSVAGGTTFGTDRLGSVSLPTAVPEPASIVLFGAGLIGLVMLRRRVGSC